MSRPQTRGEGQLPRLGTLEPEPCAGTACGSPVDDLDAGDPLLDGWIWAGVNGSRDGAAWYCSPRCSQVGIARAQLRMGAAT